MSPDYVKLCSEIIGETIESGEFQFDFTGKLVEKTGKTQIELELEQNLIRACAKEAFWNKGIYNFVFQADHTGLVWASIIN